ncbi:MAG: hypothetical protein V4710_08290 [Verrucomicrobiota bacterium]
MKIAPLLFLAATLWLAGCATVPDSERIALLQRRVSPEVYQKIVRQQRLTEADVIELSRKGLPNSSIIYYIYITRSEFTLTRADASRLKRRGVSGDVVSFMVDNKVHTLLSALLSV